MAGSTVVLEVYNPTGAIEATLPYAPRLDSLAGKTICELSNADWEHDRIFRATRKLLRERFPTLNIIPYTEAVWLKAQIDDLEYVSKVVKEKGCQAVITGMAA